MLSGRAICGTDGSTMQPNSHGCVHAPSSALPRVGGLAGNDVFLHTSKRVWRDRIGSHSVLFAPDRRGLPVVADQRAVAVLEAFDGGAPVSEALRRTSETQPTVLPIEQCHDLVQFFVERGFLRGSPDPSRYSATDLAGSEPDAFSIWLHINNHCNLDCAYCFVDKSPVEMSDEVMDHTTASIAYTVRRRRIRSFRLKFAGGEPTLSVPRMESFHSKLTHAMEGVPCEWSTGILSNGTVMSDRLIGFIQSVRSGLSISVDGHGAAGHDIFRVFKGTTRGSWAIIEKNVAKAIEHGIRPYILATVSQESARTLPELVRWVFGQGLRMRLSVVRQPTTDQAYSAFRRESRPNLADEYKKLMDAVIPAFEDAFLELESPSYFIDLRHGLNIAELRFDAPSLSSCCGIGSSHMVINERGELASCPMTVHRDTVQPTPDMLDAVRLTFASHAPRDREQNEGKNCLDCTWFPVCVSGCPINNQAVNGQPYTVSPLNPFYEYVIPRYVRFFGVKLLQAADRRGIRDFTILSS